MIVVEAVDDSARDAEHLSRADLGLFSIVRLRPLPGRERRRRGSGRRERLGSERCVAAVMRMSRSNPRGRRPGIPGDVPRYRLSVGTPCSPAPKVARRGSGRDACSSQPCCPPPCGISVAPAKAAYARLPLPEYGRCRWERVWRGRLWPPLLSYCARLSCSIVTSIFSILPAHLLLLFCSPIPPQDRDHSPYTTASCPTGLTYCTLTTIRFPKLLSNPETRVPVITLGWLVGLIPRRSQVIIILSPLVPKNAAKTGF